jgi:hypothetical protein
MDRLNLEVGRGMRGGRHLATGALPDGAPGGDERR